MKRIHIHMFVSDIAESTRFYNTLFASQPSLEKHDYVRWELADPNLNFAISDKGKAGIDHLGIQTDDAEELTLISNPFTQSTAEPQQTSCCYARSTKVWAEDPQGIQWELFQTHENESSFYGAQNDSACCGTTCAC